MASSEGADCQKQLRVLRVCKKRGELCWQHIIYTTVSTSSSKWERGCVRNYLRELRSDLAGLPAFCERIRIRRFRCLDPEPNNEF